MNTESSDICNRLTAWFLRKTSVSSVRRLAAFPAALSTDIGIVRKENQDRVAIARGQDSSGRPYILVALSDGIGGMKEGTASAAATLGSLFSSFFDVSRTDRTPELCLQHAAQAANVFVHDKLSGQGGATLSALLVTGNAKAHLLNVGDSRIYRVEGHQLTQLTVDDTIAGQLGHKIDTDVGDNLIQFIGIGTDLEAKIVPLEGDQNIKILLTSDGIHYLDSDWLGQIIENANDLGLALRRITDIAKWCGGHDNASAAMLLPYQAIQESIAHPHCDAHEIWDPFGELQLLISRLPPLQNASISRPREMGTSSSNGQTPELVKPHSGPPPPRKAEPRSKRSKRGRKQKAQAQRYEDRTSEGENKEKIPQLKIEFPKKAD